ncbi:MAG: VWA domain-containing protein [Planctomycetota bacterium]|nr:VWA domain-containing protein [Planctomycetota bacterium]
MRFESLWPWLCFPLLLVYLWWLARRSYAHLVPAARYVGLALRVAILTCLVAAISRPARLKPATHNHLIFALDVSKSISPDNLRSALDDIDRLARQAFESDSDHRISLLAFGRQPSLLVRAESEWVGWSKEHREQIEYQESLPALYAERTQLISTDSSDRQTALEALEKRLTRIEHFRDTVAGDYTDVEKALRLAVNTGSTHERRTVYVYTDGNFNQGQWLRAWRSAEETATAVHTVVLDRPLPPEVAVSEISLPQAVRRNQGFSAEIRVIATIDTTAHLEVFKDGFVVSQREVELEPGSNVFNVTGLHFREKGFHTVEATIRSERDTQVDNNTTKSLVAVPGEARVLYIDGDEDQMLYLKSALELEGMQVEARPASGVPRSLTELLSFDAFILSNVPADRLTLPQMQMIRAYVQEFGGGFVMLGGDESFGLGGYFNTPVEEILPVRMPIQKDMIRPTLGIMLVIDKSGSMSGVKIQLAKRAALATADAINPRDRIGIIGFDGESRVILELTAAADRGTIASQIAGLEAGGGTFLYPALQDAHARLLETNARRKHVIVLSDGQTQGFGYEELVQDMGADGITLSSVGIGEGADMNLMEAIATAGGGRSYFTSDFYSIPQIFTREALRASKSMLVERLVEPQVVGDDACLRDIDTDELPLLTGYVATTPKPAANLILASDTGDPLLAKWRYGLGRTVAFTSDTKPRWAEDWIEWPEFAKFWSQVIRSVTGEDLANEVDIECSHSPRDSGVALTADVRDAGGNFVTDITLELAAVDSNGRKNSLEVQRIGPGLFEARLSEIKFGQDQQFVWQVGGGGEEAKAKPYGFVYSFSPEFRTLGINDRILEQIRRRTSGRTMSVGDSQLVTADTAAREWLELWPYLLVTALVLVPFDILCRRIG